MGVGNKACGEGLISGDASLEKLSKVGKYFAAIMMFGGFFVDILRGNLDLRDVSRSILW